MDESGHAIYVVSDATAETAERTLRAALIQFRGVDPDIRIFSMVRGGERLGEILDEAAERGAMVLYTIVDPSQREVLLSRADELGLTAVDLIGHLMHQLAAFFEAPPTGRPGIPRLTADYFRRIEAMEFAVKHDDGQATRHLHLADIVLVGISRTSKTPLSTYMAQKGWKVANVPLVLDLPLPRTLDDIDPQRVFALTIDAASLTRIRRARLQALNMPKDTDYARRDHVIREIGYAREIYGAHPEWTVIDVAGRAIEETAAIILRTVEERGLASASGSGGPKAV